MYSVSSRFWRIVAAIAMTATVAIVAFGEMVIFSTEHPSLSGILTIASPLVINGAFAYLLLRRFGGLPRRRTDESRRSTAGEDDDRADT